MRGSPAPDLALCGRYHRAIELIGRRWTGAIVFLLLRSRCRFATLRAAIPDITDRMLSERLQELEEEAIVGAHGRPGDAGPRGIRAHEEGPGPGLRDRRDGGLGGTLDRTRGAPAENAYRRPSRPPRVLIRPASVPSAGL